MATVNPHLVLTTYGEIRPGDRVVNGFLNPARPDAHLIARPVREIVRTYRSSGFAPNWDTPNGVSVYLYPGGCSYYDELFVEWRDTNGSLFDNAADEAVYIVPADPHA